LHPFLHRPSRGEYNGNFLGHDYLFSGTRIAGLASFPPPHLEDAEVAKFNPTFLNERIDDGVEQILNDLTGLDLCIAKLLRNPSDDGFLGHNSFPPATELRDVTACHCFV
jgi:hypothetical protein